MAASRTIAAATSIGQDRFDARLTACPLCQSTDLRWHDRDDQGCQVERCGDCRLLLMNPQYSAAYLADYYARYYQAEGDADESQELRLGSPDSMPRQAAAKTARLDWIEQFQAPARMLSIGCGSGLELVLAAERGWEVEGYDVDEPGIASLRRQCDLTLHSGDFHSLSLPDNHYQCVYMDQVLEHPQRPQDYLRHVRRLLAPGGLLFIGCPNIGSLANRAKTILGRVGLQRRRGRHYAMDHHLFFYTPEDLSRQLAQRFGYSVVAVRGDPGNGNSASSLGSWFDRLANRARTRWPLLDSTFCLLARKPAQRGFG